MMDNLRNNTPKTVAGYPVKTVRDYQAQEEKDMNSFHRKTYKTPRRGKQM